jgi:hypothetical protein
MGRERSVRTAGRSQVIIFKVKDRRRWFRIRVGRYEHEMELIQEIPVTLQGQPVTMLNELECVGDKLYANVWLTNGIVEIDKASGNILNVIDASGR